MFRAKQEATQKVGKIRKTLCRYLKKKTCSGAVFKPQQKLCVEATLIIHCSLLMYRLAYLLVFRLMHRLEALDWWYKNPSQSYKPLHACILTHPLEQCNINMKVENLTKKQASLCFQGFGCFKGIWLLVRTN